MFKNLQADDTLGVVDQQMMQAMMSRRVLGTSRIVGQTPAQKKAVEATRLAYAQKLKTRPTVTRGDPSRYWIVDERRKPIPLAILAKTKRQKALQAALVKENRTKQNIAYVDRTIKEGQAWAKEEGRTEDAITLAKEGAAIKAELEQKLKAETAMRQVAQDDISAANWKTAKVVGARRQAELEIRREKAALFREERRMDAEEITGEMLPSPVQEQIIGPLTSRGDRTPKGWKGAQFKVPPQGIKITPKIVVAGGAGLLTLLLLL